MELGLYGKHPGWGDFVQAGLAAPLLAPLESWLDAVLAEARAALGADWEPIWDRDGAARPVLRFWLGEDLWGQPVCGVMAASRDRVGRRFPLLVLAPGAALPPPVLDAAQDWYEAAEQHLRGRLAAPSAGGGAPAALLDGLAPPEAADAVAEPGPAGFWAMGVPQDLPGLLADIAATDHRRAAAGRSYWWRVGHAAPAPEPEDLPQHPGAAGVDGAPPEAAPPEACLGQEVMAGDAPATAAAAADDDQRAAEALWQVEAAGDASAAPARAAPRAAGAGDAGADAWSGAAWLDPSLPEDPVDLSGTVAAPPMPAPPMPAPPTPAPPMPAAAPPPRPRAEPVRASQVYAGPGLPDGAVLAWLLRGGAT